MIKIIKEIREETGAGVVEIKKALDEAKNDKEKAKKILRQKGLEKAGKKKDRSAQEGVVGFYIHSDGKQAAMVKVFCETDFVARNEEFKNLAKDIAMQIAAMNPIALNKEDVSEELIKEQKEFWLKELKKDSKPEDIKQKILEGKENKLRSEKALMSQAFVKDPDKTIEILVKENISKLGEKIEIGEFIKMEI
jgi:elongation factor Ts